MRQVDKVDQFAQPSLITPAECKAQAGEVVELRIVMLKAAISLLVEAIVKANVRKILLYLLESQRTDGFLHADHKSFVQPAA